MNLSSPFSSIVNQEPKKHTYQIIRESDPDKANIGKKWSKEEENELLSKVSKGYSQEQMAKDFKRTVGGIAGRLVDIACKMILNGDNIDNASNITGISKDRINECLPVHRAKYDKKSNKTKTNKSQITQPIQSDECITLIKEIHAMLKVLVSEKSKPEIRVIKKVIVVKHSNCLIRDD